VKYGTRVQTIGIHSIRRTKDNSRESSIRIEPIEVTMSFKSLYFVFIICFSFSNHQHGLVDSLSLNMASRSPTNPSTSRRNILGKFLAVGAGVVMTTSPQSALAVPDCMMDCLKNCKKIAPKDPDYCNSSCSEYCAQEDRTDGLSGSVSAANGEVGILGGSFGQGTVPKGEDKPPTISLPGLDFSSGKGKKLLGY
jgi:hypothetical protein